MAGSYATPVTIPGWISLGQIVIGIGAILIFIGFIFGAIAVSTTPSSVSSYQGDLETFFVLVGFGILLVIGGWLFDSVWPKYRAQLRPAPAYIASAPPAPGSAAAPPPSSPPPPP